MPTFFIHDNGGRPFQVVIKGVNVSVYKLLTNIDNGYEQAYVHILDFNASKIFIGKSPLNKMSGFSGGHGKRFDGNSILLHMQENEYVFIGHEIYKFTAFSEIVKYVSPVGNSDVPYPYAIDVDNNYYLMIEDVVVTVPEEYKHDPYDYYYEASLMTPDMGRIPPEEPLFPDFHGVFEFYIGDEQYTMRYHPHPSKDYDRLAKWDDFGDGLSIDLINGSKKKLSRDEYIQLVKAFGKMANFKAIKNKKILVKRVW